MTLLGDAASCMSLFGDGSTLAIAGAHPLAEGIAAHPADPAAAFDQYEARHRALVTPRHRRTKLGASLLIPTTGPGLAAHNLALRLWPAAASQPPPA